MKIQIDHRPVSRGVTQLMYVGDDDVVDRVTSLEPATRNAGIAAVIALLANRKPTTIALAAGLAYAATKYLR